MGPRSNLNLTYIILWSKQMASDLQGSGVVQPVAALLQQGSHLLLSVLGVRATRRGSGRWNKFDALLQVAGGASSFVRRHSTSSPG